jgi:hypothetical protein
MRVTSRFRVGFAVLSATAVVLAPAGTAEAATTAALYHMESPGSLVDSSGNANNGTTKQISSVAGSSGKGYHFNGSSSVSTVPSSASLNPGTATLRLTAHVRFTEPPRSVGDYDLIRKGQAGTVGGEWKMEIFPPSSNRSSATAFCLFQDAKNNTASIRDTKNLADGAWHTITCIKTASQVTVVIDGVARSAAAKLASISNSRPLVIGSQSGGGDWYKGDMDEVSVQIG